MESPGKNLLEQGREPTTNSTHIWRQCQDLNPGHIGGRRVPSPLRHPCSPPPPACWLISLRKKDIIYQKCNSNVFAVSRHFYPWGITHRDITFLRVKMIGNIFTLLVSLKCLQGCLHCVQHCTADKTSLRFFFPWAIYRLVTANMNLKKHDQNSGHPTQAIFQRVAMK